MTGLLQGESIERSQILRFPVCLLWLLIIPVILYGAVADSLKQQGSDSTRTWSPRYLPDIFNPHSSIYNDVLNLRLHVPDRQPLLKYYDREKVIPKKFWELDYREHSYYTPRMVSDRMDQIMNRPPSDSFVPLPTVALIAASLALQQLEIRSKIQIDEGAYLLVESSWPVLFSLWNKAPQTARQLFEQESINQGRTFVTLQEHLNDLLQKKLIKIKIMEQGEDQYFPAQPRAEVQNLLRDLLNDAQRTESEIRKATELYRKIHTGPQ